MCGSRGAREQGTGPPACPSDSRDSSHLLWSSHVCVVLGGLLPFRLEQEALAWCPLPASTAPSMPGPGWSLVQEEKLQKAVSALESRHLTKNKPPRRDDPCCGQKRVLRGLNAKGLALLDRPALWGTQVQAR
uniref:Uncharacterized protein n=1 Tax=Rousettus aegyptiacus TaxID=9407 RepID=A0A7J8D6D0_ROUAE|nr:hypothetical protein HJG63_008833 [Rousettus aegyptiacus]